MKATTTTRKHSAKRTFAGILAAITLATAAVPVAAQAGILTGITASAASLEIEDGKIILDEDMNMVWSCQYYLTQCSRKSVNCQAAERRIR